MKFKLPNNVQETTTSTGVSDIALGGAIVGAKSFSSQLSNGDKTIAIVRDQVDEECFYAYYDAPNNKLVVSGMIWSTNISKKINWPAGTRDVFCGLPGTVLEGLLDPDAGSIDYADGMFGLTYRTGLNTYSTVTLTPSGKALISGNEKAQLQTLGDITTTIPATMQIGESEDIVKIVTGIGGAFIWDAVCNFDDSIDYVIGAGGNGMQRKMIYVNPAFTGQINWPATPALGSINLKISRRVYNVAEFIWNPTVWARKIW